MSYEVTRRLRLYPVNGKIESIEIESFIETILKTVRTLNRQVVCSLNTKQSFYDVSFNSKVGTGEININPETTIIWDLMSYEEHPTCIANISNEKEFDGRFYDEAIFSFDTIVVTGINTQHQEFYNKYFPNWRKYKEENRIKENINETTIDCLGYYTACNQREIGNYNRRIVLNEPIYKTNNNNQLKFQLELTNNIFEEIKTINPSEYLMFNLSEFTWHNIYINEYQGLKKIEFLFKGRKVKSIEWTNWKHTKTGKSMGSWEHRSADWWDNCVNATYAKFEVERKS